MDYLKSEEVRSSQHGVTCLRVIHDNGPGSGRLRGRNGICLLAAHDFDPFAAETFVARHSGAHYCLVPNMGGLLNMTVIMVGTAAEHRRERV